MEHGDALVLRSNIHGVVRLIKGPNDLMTLQEIIIIADGDGAECVEIRYLPLTPEEARALKEAL